MTIRLSVVVLTLDEAEHIGACLTALARQTVTDFEVIVVDADSRDGTPGIVARAQDGFPVPLRLLAADRRLSVGEARNQGVALARAPHVAFLSADTEAHAGWVEQALTSLQDYDIVYGRQLHAPIERTAAAAVRGLRYHFPDDTPAEPARYASNANAALRREVIGRFPFGTTPEAGAVDDLLLTARARRAGYTIGYDPDMIVAHRDVTDLRGALSKNLREAAGWGAYVDELGLHELLLAWGAVLLGASLAALADPSLLTLGLLVTVLWAPAARRLLRRWDRMRGRDLLVAFFATPFFDIAFLAQYLRYLVFGPPTETADDGEEMKA